MESDMYRAISTSNYTHTVSAGTVRWSRLIQSLSHTFPVDTRCHCQSTLSSGKQRNVIYKIANGQVACTVSVFFQLCVKASIIVNSILNTYTVAVHVNSQLIHVLQEPYK